MAHLFNSRRRCVPSLGSQARLGQEHTGDLQKQCCTNFHGRAASNSRKDGNDEATAKQNATSAHGDFLKKFGELHLKE
jgi:hypothetical protein